MREAHSVTSIVRPSCMHGRGCQFRATSLGCSSTESKSAEVLHKAGRTSRQAPMKSTMLRSRHDFRIATSREKASSRACTHSAQQSGLLAAWREPLQAQSCPRHVRTCVRAVEADPSDTLELMIFAATVVTPPRVAL